tara:strand:- start:639 stop:1052 length:414 start_codon:yes stop_codon:yes gene_type:complete
VAGRAKVFIVLSLVVAGFGGETPDAVRTASLYARSDVFLPLYPPFFLSRYHEGMVLNIKDPEADRLARALAAATGESITVAARAAFAERLARVQARDAAPEVLAELEGVIARARERETLDDRTTDEILGYDDDGLPS